MSVNLLTLPAAAGAAGCYHVIIETPKGSRNKFDYDPETQLFMLNGVLPEGSSFPYDFGFVPSTVGQDGDPHLHAGAAGGTRIYGLPAGGALARRH